MAGGSKRLIPDPVDLQIAFPMLQMHFRVPDSVLHKLMERDIGDVRKDSVAWANVHAKYPNFATQAAVAAAAAVGAEYAEERNREREKETVGGQRDGEQGPTEAIRRIAGEFLFGIRVLMGTVSQNIGAAGAAGPAFVGGIDESGALELAAARIRYAFEREKVDGKCAIEILKVIACLKAGCSLLKDDVGAASSFPAEPPSPIELVTAVKIVGKLVDETTLLEVVDGLHLPKPRSLLPEVAKKSCAMELLGFARFRKNLSFQEVSGGGSSQNVSLNTVLAEMEKKLKATFSIHEIDLTDARQIWDVLTELNWGAGRDMAGGELDHLVAADEIAAVFATLKDYLCEEHIMAQILEWSHQVDRRIPSPGGFPAWAGSTLSPAGLKTPALTNEEKFAEEVAQKCIQAGVPVQDVHKKFVQGTLGRHMARDKMACYTGGQFISTSHNINMTLSHIATFFLQVQVVQLNRSHYKVVFHLSVGELFLVRYTTAIFPNRIPRSAERPRHYRPAERERRA